MEPIDIFIQIPHQSVQLAFPLLPVLVSTYYSFVKCNQILELIALIALGIQLLILIFQLLLQLRYLFLVGIVFALSLRQRLPHGLQLASIVTSQVALVFLLQLLAETPLRDNLVLQLLV